MLAVWHGSRKGNSRGKHSQETYKCCHYEVASPSAFAPICHKPVKVIENNQVKIFSILTDLILEASKKDITDVEKNEMLLHRRGCQKQISGLRLTEFETLRPLLSQSISFCKIFYERFCLRTYEFIENTHNARKKIIRRRGRKIINNLGNLYI